MELVHISEHVCIDSIFFLWEIRSQFISPYVVICLWRYDDFISYFNNEYVLILRQNIWRILNDVIASS